MIVAEYTYSTDPDLVAQRMERRPHHRDLTAAALADGRIVFSGPKADGTGAVIGVDGDMAAFEAYVGADPYWSTPGVELVRATEIDAIYCRPHATS